MLDLPVAAQHYIDYMNPFHGRAFLGAPAITSDPNSGIPWLKGFIAACAGRCIIDFYTVHWYGNWDQQIDFLNFAIPLMDRLDWVVRYAWWWTQHGSDGALTDGNGFPTQLGHVYTYKGL